MTDEQHQDILATSLALAERVRVGVSCMEGVLPPQLIDELRLALALAEASTSDERTHILKAHAK